MATALRLREALALSAPWRPPDLGFLAPAFFVLGTAYLALFLYLFLFYLPAQLKDLRPIGGYLGGFFRHPLLRLRHLHLAYAGLGERLLALLLFLATLAALLLYGLDAKARAALWAPPLDQGTLFTPAAQEWARSLPPTPGAKALQGYTLLRDNPTQARALLREGAPLPFALALLGEKELVLAYEKAPWSGPVRSLLGLGADPWGPREPAPTLRTLYTLLLEAEARRLAEDPWRGFSQLPSPFPRGTGPGPSPPSSSSPSTTSSPSSSPEGKASPPPPTPSSSASSSREASASAEGLGWSFCFSPPTASGPSSRAQATSTSPRPTASTSSSC